jgi:thiol-disulfide isomerase/thioredoxin
MKLIFYKQPGCAPCDERLPVAQAVAEDTGIEMVVWDVAEHKKLAEKHRVRATPTLVLIDETTGERKTSWYGKLIHQETVAAHIRRS